jgi:hypothetical protein
MDLYGREVGGFISLSSGMGRYESVKARSIFPRLLLSGLLVSGFGVDESNW